MLECQQHLVFPGGHPSKYYPDPTLLNFADRTRSGAFNVVWSLASDIEETKDLNIKLFFFFFPNNINNNYYYYFQYF